PQADRAAKFRTVERFVDNFANGPSAAAALGATAKATIDVTSGPPRGGAGGGSYLMVAQHVAGTDDHQNPLPGNSLTVAHRQVKIKLFFKNVLIYCLTVIFCGVTQPQSMELRYFSWLPKHCRCAACRRPSLTSRAELR